MNEPFELRNDPIVAKPLEFEHNPKGKQKVLFAGMKCLPGQQDLFETDGAIDPEIDSQG